MNVGPIRERGSIAVFSVVLLLALMGLLGFLVEQSVATVVSQRQQTQLEACSHCLSGQSFSLMMKSSDDPGRLTASVACRQLRSSGYDGAVAVWYWESPSGEGRDGPKVAVWGVQLEERIITPLSSLAGVSSIPVASCRTDWRLMWSAVWSAEGSPWRPANVTFGKYVLGKDESAPDAEDAEGVLEFQQVDDLSLFPVAVRDQANRALQKATEYEGEGAA